MPGQWYGLKSGEWRSPGRISIDAQDPPVDNDYGEIGARPAVLTPPSGSDTGPRSATMQTLTGAQAMTTIKAATPELDGKKYLRRTLITSTLDLSTTGADALVFEDCVLDAGQSTWYGVLSNVAPTGPWVEFRHCELTGGSAATLRGGYMRILRCDVHHGGDLVKPYYGMEIWASWLHDNYRDVDAHCDTIQIVAGCDGLLIHYNTLSGFVSADSPNEPSGYCSGVLQTGPVSATVGPVAWTGNWISGGRYAIRGSSAQGNGYSVTQIFRDNRFTPGSFQYGPSAFIAPGSEDFDASNVWDDTGLPVEV